MKSLTLAEQVAMLTRIVQAQSARINKLEARGQRPKPKPREASRATVAKMEPIVALAAFVHKVPEREIMGQSRFRHVVEARQWVMMEARDAGLTFIEIARFIGRDHTTILHGAKAAKARKSAMNQADNTCPSGPFVQDSERDGERGKRSTAPNRRSTWIRGANMADVSQYSDSAPLGNPEQNGGNDGAH